MCGGVAAGGELDKDVKKDRSIYKKKLSHSRIEWEANTRKSRGDWKANAILANQTLFTYLLSH